MKTIVLLLAALAAGYLGGCLALVRAQEKEKTQLRGAMDELLSELTFVAAKSCEQLVDERRRVEQLIKKLRENKIINMPSEEFLSDTGQFGQAIDTKTILRAHSQNEPSCFFQAVEPSGNLR